MNDILIYYSIVAAVSVVTALVVIIFFKKSIVLNLVISIMLMCINIISLSYYAGKFGIINLYWILPVLALIFALSIHIIYKSLIYWIRKMIKLIPENHKDPSFKFEDIPDNEIGLLMKYYNSHSDNLNSIIGKIYEMCSISKNYCVSIVSSSELTRASIGEIIDSIKSMKMLADKLEVELNETSTASEEINSSIKIIKEQIVTQNLFINDSHAALNEMLSSVSNIEKITEEKKRSSDELVKLAESGETGMKSLTDAIGEISKSTGIIAELIKIISMISSELNFLSINAAIEASHAGEHGKGFTIVAEEVRELAESTSRNIKNITSSLHDIIGKINTTSEITNKTGEQIGRVILGIKNISESMNDMLFRVKEFYIGTSQITLSLCNLLESNKKFNMSADGMFDRTERIISSIKEAYDYSMENNGNINEISKVINEIMNASMLLSDINNENTNTIETLENEAKKFLSVK